MSLSLPRRYVRRVSWFLFAGGIVQAGAQPQLQTSVQPEPQLSPQAAYEEAVRPLEITRRSPQNWSEIELAALKIARENAKKACNTRNPDRLQGKDLLALAHLCAFALDWGAVHWAAADYVEAAEKSPPTNQSGMTDLATAFDYRVQAYLNLENPDEAVTTAQTMLRTVPYDVFTSEATTSTIESIRFTHTDQALALLKQRQPIILAMMKAGGPTGSGAPESSGSAPDNSILPLHVLYADALALPFMQKFTNKAEDAEASYGELQAALPHNLFPDEAILIQQRQRQYQLLGEHLPVLKPTGSLLSPDLGAPENLNTWFAKATLFLLFPDWCNQCVTLAYNSDAKGRDLASAYKVRLVPLLAQANPPEKRAEPGAKDVPLSTKAAKAALAHSQPLHVDQQVTVKSTPDSILAGTPTVVVPNETLTDFAADDFPLMIVTDHNGIVRWIQRASDSTFAEDGDADRIIKHVLEIWPAQ